MDNRIFNLGLSVEAASAYIMICAVAHEGLAVTVEHIRARWHAHPNALVPALEELLSANVISVTPESLPEGVEYKVQPAHLWGRRAPWPEPTGLPVFPKK